MCGSHKVTQLNQDNLRFTVSQRSERCLPSLSVGDSEKAGLLIIGELPKLCVKIRPDS